MTKFQATRAGDYPTLGFRANTATAILDGSISTPVLTIPPDASWSVYGGGSAETGITRYTNPVPTPIPPTPEITSGWMLAYSDPDNTFRPLSPVDLLATQAWSDGIAGIERFTSERFGLFNAEPSARIPFAANPTVFGPDAVADSSGINTASISLNPKVKGNFTGIGGVDPGYWWGLNVFAIVDEDVTGITTPTALLGELAILQAQGVILQAIGGSSDVSLFGPGVAPRVQSGVGFRAAFGGRKNNPTTFTASTTSGSSTLTLVSSFNNISVGDYIDGPGLPVGTKVTALNTGPGSITMSQNATVTDNGKTFYLGVFDLIRTLVVENAEQVPGAGSRVSLHVEGGTSLFDGRLDVLGTIIATGTQLELKSDYASGAKATLGDVASGGNIELQVGATSSGAYFKNPSGSVVALVDAYGNFGAKFGTGSDIRYITLGAADSGGTGKRVLVVNNS